VRRARRCTGNGAAPPGDRGWTRLDEDLGGVAAGQRQRVEPSRDRAVFDFHRPAIMCDRFSRYNIAGWRPDEPGGKTERLRRGAHGPWAREPEALRGEGARGAAR